MTTLTVSELTVRYGGVLALDAVSFTVVSGELVGLIGPNGAGKTTCIDAICGFASAAGQVTLDHHVMTGERAFARARAGLGRTWQQADLFDDLTVAENLSVGAYRPGLWHTAIEVLRGRSSEQASSQHIPRMLGIEHLLSRRADGLSAGQRKLVDVARALAGDPPILLLDEPAAGLDTNESKILGQRLRSIVDSGKGMLLVDHDMSLVLSVCDRIVVLDFGAVLAVGTPAEIRQNQDVINAYLGRTATETTTTAAGGRQ
ncbi:ABC transporter ATP-binding protein [Nocardia sp. XZ_19_385]|uniref:ABC transporter ATP-binding protein n=1 Tax=Nocardia sp. XZ_19_385 TaxID=2769488 RepID=UPI00188E2159|nr:ATP-binding cassette domain-containing protein [Nocardia sp. XZ_19_385]